MHRDHAFGSKVRELHIYDVRVGKWIAKACPSYGKCNIICSLIVSPYLISYSDPVLLNIVAKQ